MNMIEKVARGIFEVDNKHPYINRLVYGTDAPTWDLICSKNIIPKIKEEYMNRAKAAIAAMREPSEGMLKAGEDDYCNEVDLELYWHNMIDAALKE